jgi:serine/threonine-protein kinase
MSVPTSSPADAQARLFRLLPHDYPVGTCTPRTAPQDALAQVSCEKNSDPGGPQSATYLMFADATALHSALDRVVEGSRVTECPGRIQSPGAWYRNATPDGASGTLMCGTQDGNPILAWTNDAELMISVTNAGPQGPTIEQLYQWWTTHS